MAEWAKRLVDRVSREARRDVGWFPWEKRPIVAPLDAVTAAPAEARARGVIETPNWIESPLTGFRAASFFWRFARCFTDVVEYTSAVRWVAQTNERDAVEEVARTFFGADFTLRTDAGRLLVNTP